MATRNCLASMGQGDVCTCCAVNVCICANVCIVHGYVFVQVDMAT